MAFQTNVLRDGAWVTRTIDLQTVLKAPTTAAPSPPLPVAPSCGILTRTIIESPVVHWILPARLRSAHNHDVAFVGDHFVQISELREDGQLHQVLRKNDFGSRIRNARVIGNTYEKFAGGEDPLPDNIIKTEDEGVDKIESRRSTGNEGVLPPHLLLLVLESGGFIFLFLRKSLQGDLEFAVAPFNPPIKKLSGLAFHLAVDPRSRYVAVSGIENKFVVYELQSRDLMVHQYAQSGEFSPVRKFHPRAVQGIIQKMEFLHPRPEDDYHLILLLILVKNGKSRMVIYEWEHGDELSRVFAEEKQGHRLPNEHQMPLLLIPLTVRNSFFAVSQNSIGICKDPLQGPPNFEAVDPGTHAATRFHHGVVGPLWTAWDRPVRRKGYYETKDNIYLAREDGVIVFFEINSVDILGAAMNVGCCNCSISTAFTTVYDSFSDVAIVGGDSGPGTICQLRPRAPLIELGTIPNWSPTLDFVTTDEYSVWNQEVSHTGRRMIPWQERTREQLAGGDRVFGISGKGAQGSITEFRHGIQANIGLDLEYGSPMKQSWIFPAQLPNLIWGFYLLLALPDGSDVLHLSGDLAQASAPDPGTAQFDIASRTLAASQGSDQRIIQVTEQSITLVTPSQSSRHEHASFRDGSAKAEHASIRGSFVAFSTHSQNHSSIYLVRVDDMATSLIQTYEAEGEVTCLAFCNIKERPYVLAGVWRRGTPWLAAYPVNDMPSSSATLIEIDLDDAVNPETNIAYGSASETMSVVEALTSIVLIKETTDETVLVLGSRGGYVITAQLTGEPPFRTSIHKEKLGIMAVEVLPVEAPFLAGSALVYCDAGLLLLRDYDSQWSSKFKTRLRIWATDARNPSMPSPSINSATSLRQSLSGQPDHMSLVMLAGDRILVTELAPEGKPVPRRLPLGGTPTKLLFSHTLQCLVVGLKIEDRPTLQFLDPDTGANLAKPTDRNGDTVDFISGLGNPGDRIQGLYEWLYLKDGKTWLFIIVTTKEGRLLIVSTEREDSQDANMPAKRIRYWTRYKKKGLDEPIYSVVGDAEGLIYCVGRILHWEVLDLSEKKLKPKKTFELNSPATSLRVVNNQIYALTTQHSLIVIDHHSETQHEDMTLVHSDEAARYSMHMIDMGHNDDGKAAWPVTLLCDQRRSFAGIWIPWKERGREFQVVFEGELPSTVRKLRRGHIRPAWISAEHPARYGCIPSTVDGGEVLGVCLDGSVQHFTLLNMKIWRFLRLLQNLALRDSVLNPISQQHLKRSTVHMQADHGEEEDDDDEEYDAEPKESPKSMMHIDGDMLQRCLEKRAMERLISNDNNVDMLREYLDDLDGGKWTAAFQEENDIAKYFGLGYDILEYYLAPVL